MKTSDHSSGRGDTTLSRLPRPTIGRKLAAAFLLFMVLTAGNLLLAEWLYDSAAEIPQFVDRSGRLRYLSQQIAQQASAGAARETLRRLLDDYETALTLVERDLADQASPLSAAAVAPLQALRREWRDFRSFVEMAAGVPVDLEQVRSRGDAMLARADAVVVRLVDQAEVDHRRVDGLLLLAILLDTFLLVVVYRLIRGTVILPIAEAAGALRRFAAGDRAVRLPRGGDDEIGDLAQAFNVTAANTDRLIHELATKSAILDETTDLVGSAATDGRILFLNPAGLAMLGLDAKVLDGMGIEDTHPAWAAKVVIEQGMPAARRDGSWRGETALRGPGGTEIPVSQVIIAHRGTDGDVAYFSTIARDISDRIRMEDRLIESRDFYLRLFHDFPNPIWRSGIDGGRDYFNKAWLDFTGRELQQELGEGWTASVHPDDEEHLMLCYREAFAARFPFETEYRLRHRDGGYRWILDCGSPYFGMDGVFAGFIGSCHDITKRKRYEAQLEHQATHDVLTGLPNRSLLADRIGQALYHADRSHTCCAVLFLDLDQFKFVNDSLGHEAGDLLLADVACRLKAAVRQDDTVARQGGDEFVIVLGALAGADGAIDVVRKLLLALEPPFVIDGHDIFVTASIGIGLYPQDGTDAATLLRHADMAMYRAKEEGRNNFQFFAADMNARVCERLSLEGSLRRALEREELMLCYQPQVDLVSGQVIGMEALLRWHHPELGLVPPVRFVPLAEETGLIVPIGTWVLKKACAQAKAWQDAGLPPLTVGVNLSARQFQRHDLVAGVKAVLAETGLAPRYLDLELTESMIMRDPERVVAVLGELAAMGVQLSVDDFGTGYSSLSYLKRFPIHKVKIDQSFVRDITTDPDDAAIAKTIVSIAHDMRMKVIAEGPETEAQVNALCLYGCDEIQGYYFSPPLSADEFAELLHSGRRLARGRTDETPERTLLLVDDEASILSALTRLLRPDGYRILRADSGMAALDMLANHQIGVIVSDQRMPGMSGVEFLRRAKQIHPETVRMVLSGYTELKSVTDAINEGAVYKFLTKPWDDKQLRENIREAFHQYELRAENARLARQLGEANTRLSLAKGELELEVERSVDVLRVSQEMIEVLPVGAIGVDIDGCIVAANRQAEQVLAGDPPQTLLGMPAAECLPAPLAAAIGRVLVGGGEARGNWRSARGEDYGYWCRLMGTSSGSQGALLAVLPLEMDVTP